MRRNILLAALLFLFLLGFESCSTAGMFASANMTNVDLREPNYKIVATNISGTSEAGYVVGFTVPLGYQTSTLAIARVSGTGMLYKEAIENLWSNFKSKYGDIEGKKLALINIRYDTDALNLFIYTSAKIFVRADVIQFE